MGRTKRFISKHKPALIIGLLTVLTAIIYSFFTDNNPTKILHNTQNEYGTFWVYQNETERCLSFDPPYQGARQSCLLLANTDHLALEYQKMILGALYLNKTPPKDILMIGLGGGTLARTFLRLLPKAHMDIVEVNPDIPHIAEQFFLFQVTNNTRIFIEEGFDFIQRMVHQKKYDLIVVDAFGKDYVPNSFLTPIFAATLKRCLKPDGVVAINTFQSSQFYDLESQLYENAFGNFFNVALTNRIIIAKNGSLPTQAQLTKNASPWQAGFQVSGVENSWLLPKFELYISSGSAN